MALHKTAVFDVDELPDSIGVYIWPNKDDYMIYTPRKYCYVDIVLNEDDPAIGSTTCSKCKAYVEPFIKFCPNCGAKSKGRRLLQKREEKDNEEDSPIRL